MKIKHAVLKQPLSIAALNISGVSTLGAGNVREKEVLSMKDGYVHVSRNGKVVIIPLDNFQYIVLDTPSQPE